MEKKTKIYVGIGIGLLVLLLLLLFVTKGIGLAKLDTDSYGHGDSYKSSWHSFSSSFLTALGIPEDYDYVDEDGEGYCLNNVCWADAQLEYETCLDDIGAMELSPSGIESFINYMDVMPSAYALAPDLPADEEDICNDHYVAKITSECSVSCEKEVYTWDGTSVDNIGDFYATNYPNTVASWKSRCESWIHGGTWVQTANKVGCTNAILMGCGSNSVISGGDVCGTVGYTFTCGDGNNIVCEK